MAKHDNTRGALPVLNPHAAGIDIGATEIFAAVPGDSCSEPVRRFDTFTPDLLELAQWLKECGIKTVAMESTGVYWIPVFQILEARGFEVCLVNARQLHNVPGRKSDVSDSRWLQHLHACGLLRASFRPDEEVCAVRALVRHREELIRCSVAHVQHMQKALTQMNIQLHNVISSITGKTGLAIIDAILDGERDPEALAEYRDARVRASRETICKSLIGDYRPEHLFTLAQALKAYRHYLTLIAECDAEIERMFAGFATRDAPPSGPDGLPPQAASAKPARGNMLRFNHTDVNTELLRLFGVDITVVPGFGALTLYTLFTEIGRDLEAFPSSKHFASWLGLCPNNKITGGRVISSSTNRVPSRAACAFRMAARSLWHSQSHLGDYHRATSARIGKPAAITATAHKLARIFYHLVTTQEPYNEGVFAREQERMEARTERRLRAQAAARGYTLVKAAPVS